MDNDNHNRQILQKREEDVQSFMELTGADHGQAQAYMKQAAFDVDVAAGAYFDSGGAKIAEDDAATADLPFEGFDSERAETSNQNGGGSNEEDDITAIMSKATEMKPELERERKVFRGHGRSIGASANHNQQEAAPQKKLRITFYVNGFTASWDDQKSSSRNERTSGITTYKSSLMRELQNLPPLRPYESNKQFLDDVKGGRVPEEFRGEWQVTIVLSDLRPKPYPKEAGMMGGSAFSGTGQTLGGTSAELIADSSQQLNLHKTEGQKRFPSFWLGAVVYDILMWLVSFISRVLGITWSPKLSNRREPIVDFDKPTTTVAVKLASGSRIQATFNTSATCSDVYRFVEFKMIQELGCNIDFVLPSFDLFAGYPPKLLSDSDKEILQAAGLTNAAVTQRIKKQD